MGSWASEWRGPLPPDLAKKVVFLVSIGRNKISPVLAPPWKNNFGYHWKNQLCYTPGKNPDEHGLKFQIQLQNFNC